MDRETFISHLLLLNFKIVASAKYEYYVHNFVKYDKGTGLNKYVAVSITINTITKSISIVNYFKGGTTKKVTKDRVGYSTMLKLIKELADG